MTDAPPDTPDTEPDDLDRDTPGTEPDTDEPDEWTPPDKSAWDKLEEKARTREKLLRDAQAKLAKLSKGKGADTDTPDAEPDPADTLRTALRRTAAASVLAGRGIVDKDEQAAVLSVMHLDALDIGEDGEVDTDNLSDTLDTLGRIFGKGRDKRTVPPVDTRRGSRDSGDTSDPDTKRYRRVMGRA